jgi:CHAT domain-containing protein
VATTYQNLADSAPKTNRNLQRLYRLLIEPIANSLPANSEEVVTIIPAVELLALPFAALQTSAGKSLIEQHPLVISPSIDALRFDLPHKAGLTEFPL